jgi:uncharacterized tellurite resistance protein B-like protein
MKGFGRLTRAERLQVMKFVCAVAWADLEVNRSEESFILSLALRLGLPKDEIQHVREWLERPPSPDEVDPNLIPQEHRALLLQAVEETVAADGMVDGPERESLQLLRDLLG